MAFEHSFCFIATFELLLHTMVEKQQHSECGISGYYVHLRLSLAALNITAHCEFPEYTRKPPADYREADLDIPQGTDVVLTLGLNMPIRTAAIVSDEGRDLPSTLSEDGRTLVTSFEAVDRVLAFSISFSIRAYSASASTGLTHWLPNFDAHTQLSSQA